MSLSNSNGRSEHCSSLPGRSLFPDHGWFANGNDNFAYLVRRALYLFLSFIVIVQTHLSLQSQTETRNIRGYANHLAIPGSFIQSHDDKFINGTFLSGFTNRISRTVIELGWDEDKHFAHSSALKVCAKFDVQIQDAAGSSTVITNQQLSIDYNPGQLTRYKDKDQLVFTNIYFVKVFNVSMTACTPTTSCNTCTLSCTLPDVYLQAEVISNRIYNFNYSAAFVSTEVKDSITSKKELKISWPFLKGATDYEIQYTFVDDYHSVSAGSYSYIPASNLAFDFSHDATNVITNRNYLYIPLTYEHGYILYRVRPIGLNSSGKRIEGTWYPTAASGTVSSASCVVSITPDLPADQLPWSATRGFAENGKSSTAVLFSDAKGLVRQQLQRLNTESKTIANSTLYDYFARPVIQMLPSPVSGIDFRYRSDLNLHTNSSNTTTVFDKRIFDKCTVNNPCNPSGFTITPGVSVGASNYYSASNSDKEGYQGYLPNANGYPYTQVKFTNDGTERIARQSLPGATHFVGSGKDIRYLYGQPTQVELDRLFGKEAGRAAFYKKNYTIDPNGQTRATYLDPQGRVIATSLIGLQPSNHNALPNMITTATLTEDYSAAPWNVEMDFDRCKEVSARFVVPSEVTHTQSVLYQTTIAGFASTCLTNICYDCVYDVTLTLQDECSTEYLPSGAFFGTIGGSAPYVPGTCAGTSTAVIKGTSVDMPIAVTFSRAGTYVLHKKICVSDAPVNDYADHFTLNSCDQDYCDIFNTLLHESNFNTCGTCTDCISSVNSQATVTTGTTTMDFNGPLGGGTLPGGDGQPGTTTSQPFYTSSLTPEQANSAYENCISLNRPTDRCSVLENAMMADFYPGTGQYAATSSLAATWSISIFNPSNVLGTGAGGSTPTWSGTANSYSNAIGVLDAVTINGATVAPHLLTLDQFTENFRKSWAKTLLKYHPENCKRYFYCELLNESFEYDEKIRNISHFDQACTEGVAIPVPFPANSYSPAPAQNCLTTYTDPIGTQCSTLGLSGYSNFTLNLSSNTKSSGKNIYEWTLMQLNPTIATVAVNATMGINPCTADEDWQHFKYSYLSQKEMLYTQLLSQYTANPSSFGGPTCYSLTSGLKSHFMTGPQILSTFMPGTSAAADFTTVMDPSFDPNSASTQAIIDFTTAASNFSVNGVTSPSTIAAQCENACLSYTAGWHFDLSQSCTGYGNASASTQTAIIAAMVEVCKKGCDYLTFLSGASTTSPGLSYTLPSSSQTVTSFQEVLNYYLCGSTSNSTCTDACMSSLVSRPPPYPVMGSTVSPNSLSGCKCDIIMKVADDFTATAHLGYEWQLFEQYYGFDLPDYYKLKCVCTATAPNWSPGYSWTASQQAFLASNAPLTDSRLECASCLSCTDVVTAMNSMTLPVTSTLTSVTDRIRKNYGNQLAVLTRLNSLFGVHTLETYLDLYEDCSTYTATNTFSNTLTGQTHELMTYLNSLVESGKLASTNRPTSYCYDSKYYLSTLYDGPVPVITSYTYNTSTSSNTIDISLSPVTGPTINVTLAYPPGFSGTWNWDDITNLHDYAAFAPAPGAPGAVYMFQVDATLTDLSVYTLTGNIVSGSYPIAYLSAGSYTVPAVCPAEKNLPKVNACVASIVNNALNNAKLRTQEKILERRSAFIKQYKDFCYSSLDGAEKLTRSYSGADEYQFTLYYYDQAGNLYRTVAPNGADPGLLSGVTSPLPANTTSLPAYSSSTAVQMNYATAIEYNSYEQPLQSHDIDGGKTIYSYDLTGRLMWSQNAKQHAAGTSSTQVFSYSLYDGIGRIKETGVATLLATSLPTVTIYAAFESIVINTSTTTRKEVTNVYYDFPTTNTTVLSTFADGAQKRLRNRVSYVTHTEVYPPLINYDHATYYSYDDRGNVTELVQDNSGMSVFNQNLKDIRYEYEEISGNMVRVAYQHGKADCFMHRYIYDADNRLHEVYTSRDSINWNRDAKYFYYQHGPLARIEHADQKVHGTDYFYTIHGWIKGVNSDALNRTSDIGKDGGTGNKYLSAYADVHRWMPADVRGYGLSYYNVGGDIDYEPIKTFTTADLNPVMSTASFSTAQMALNALNAADGPSLFDGNISAMTTGIIDKDPTNTWTDNTAFPQVCGYRYDQADRLVTMKSFRGFNSAAAAWNQPGSGNCDDAYRMAISYDNNGNILTLNRKGAGTNLSANAFDMDDLSYSYFNDAFLPGMTINDGGPTTYTSLGYNSNRLRCVVDGVSAANYSGDVDNGICDAHLFTVVNYTNGTSVGSVGYNGLEYDEVGNLVKNRAEYIDNIEWTTDRKVRRITRDYAAMASASVSLPDIEYIYNASRQRAIKIVKPNTMAYYWIYTYYIYDAQGNVMATYNRVAYDLGVYQRDVLSINAHHIYGSERLALFRPADSVCVVWYPFDSECELGEEVAACRMAPTGPVVNYFEPPGTTYTLNHHLGCKDFELTNHLGNVITTVSDRKLYEVLSPGPCLKTYNFGTGVPPAGDINANYINLSVSGSSLVCTMMINSFISGLAPKFGNNIVPGNYVIEFDFDPGNLTMSDGFYAIPFEVDPGHTTWGMGPYFWTIGSVPPAGHYSLSYTPIYTGSGYDSFIAFNTNGTSNHYFKIANVKMCPVNGGTSVISYSADITSTTDYYPFGQSMPARSWVGSDEYRYGMNGQEKDDEIASGLYTAEYWEYDSRIGRRWNIDPIRKPWESPYATFNNNPIYYSDPLGLDGEPPNPNGTKGGPKQGETCTNPPGSGQSGEIFDNGQWVRQGGTLDEVIVTPSMPAATTGNGPANGQPNPTPRPEPDTPLPHYYNNTWEIRWGSNDLYSASNSNTMNWYHVRYLGEPIWNNFANQQLYTGGATLKYGVGSINTEGDVTAGYGVFVGGNLTTGEVNTVGYKEFSVGSTGFSAGPVSVTRENSTTTMGGIIHNGTGPAVATVQVVFNNTKSTAACFMGVYGNTITTVRSVTTSNGATGTQTIGTTKSKGVTFGGNVGNLGGSMDVNIK